MRETKKGGIGVSFLVSLAGASILSAGFLFAEEQQVGIIGYIDHSRFHPLVLVTPQTITRADSTKLVLRGKLRHAFRDSPEAISIKKQEDYVDPFGKETPGRFGLVDKEDSIASEFYWIGSNHLPSESPDSHAKEIRNFYAFFSRDEWGRHFVDGNLLSKPVKEIAKTTNVRVHVVTDLNHNSLPELWITYKLTHGEIGRMVYEQTEDRLRWKQIANHCFMCD